MSLPPSVINRVTVLGAGVMGAGIAQIAAASGHRVTLVDVTQDALAHGLETIKASLARIARKKFEQQLDEQTEWVETTLNQIETTTNGLQAAKDTDLVIEAITENMGVKRKVWAELDSVAPSHTIFASNTSSLSIAVMAEATRRADRMGGLHFFNPVPVMKLVEVVRTASTSDATHDALVQFGKQVGKTPVTCKDTPGFIVNRLLVPYLMDATRMLERGDASAEDIDLAMRLGAGHPMGPFTLMDTIGLDVCKHIIDGWHDEWPDEPAFKCPELLTKLVAEGRVGRKAGRGFYSYDQS